MKYNDLILIIDMQNVYLPQEEWACPSMPEVTERILRLINSMRDQKIALTKFTAPVQPTGRWKQYNAEYQSINENAYLNNLTDPFRNLAKEHCIYEKNVYSSMKIQEVKELAKQSDRLVLTGVVAECCVLSTLMEAIDEGIPVIYLYDCVSGQNAENEAMVRRIAESFSPVHVQVMSSEEYMKKDNKKL